MIKNIFLPEKIGNYYLFSQSIVGLDIGKAYIKATQLQVSGNKIVVSKSIEHPIAHDAAGKNRVVHALSAVAAQLDPFDELKVVLPSSLVVFKELNLPFISYEKIKMVINFEVEPLLPFSIQDAVVDFIITKIDVEKNSAQVLVGAVQKQQVHKYMQWCQQAELNVTAMVIDFFGVYALYKNIPVYQQHTKGVALIDIGFDTTHIAHIDDGQLRFVRSLNKGVVDIAKMIAHHSKANLQEVMDHLLRFGVTTTDQHEHNAVVTQVLNTFLKDIEFTLASFVAKSGHERAIDTVLLLGGGAHIKGIIPHMAQLLHIHCELFSVKSLIEHNIVTVKNHISDGTIISLGAALPSPITSECNLLHGELLATQATLTAKQVVVAGVLTCLLFLSVATCMYIRLGAWQHEVAEAQKEAIDELRTHFNTISAEDTDLEDVITIAQAELAQQETTWFAFSSQARASFLKYLLELTNLIDQKSIGLVVSSISIADGVMILKAHVNDHESLITLERELRKSKLFKYVEPQTDIDFTKNGMKIFLMQNGGEK